MQKDYKVKFTLDSGELIFTFKQLSFRTKSEITSLVTGLQNGQLSIDSTMQVFYNLKYALKSVEGLKDAEGNEYKLKFDDKQRTTVTDECLDELLATSFSDALVYTGREFNNAMLPEEIKHPLTGAKLEGVEVMTSNAGGVAKKS